MNTNAGDAAIYGLVCWDGISFLFSKEYLDFGNIPDCANNMCLYLSCNHS